MQSFKVNPNREVAMKVSFIHFLNTSLMISTLVLTAACGKSSSGNGTPAVNPYVVCTNGVCSAQVNNPNASFGFYGENYRDRNVSITNGPVYREFLKNALGVCDRATYSGGMASCDQWVNGGFDVVLQGQSASSNTLTAIFRVWPQPQNPYYTYTYQAPSFGNFLAGLFGFPVFEQSGAVRNPLIVNLTVSLTNNSQGFEARGYGDLYTTANRSLIQVLSSNSKLTDNTMGIQLAFPSGGANSVGTVFATGNFIRCQTASCTPVTPW